MGIKLICEVLDHAPADLSSTERLLLLVIAENARDDTRRTWFRETWTAEIVARRVGISIASIGKVLYGLAKKGVDVRESDREDSRGKKVYAHKGKQVTFKVPKLAPESSDERPTIEPESSDDGQGFESQRSDDGPLSPDARPTKEAQRSDQDPTLSLKVLSLRNPSSSGPTVRHVCEQASVDDEEAGRIIDHIRTKYRPDKLRGYVRSMPAHDLIEIRDELRQSATVAKPAKKPKCGNCDPNRLVTLSQNGVRRGVARCPDCGDGPPIPAGHVNEGTRFVPEWWQVSDVQPGQEAREQLRRKMGWAAPKAEVVA